VKKLIAIILLIANFSFNLSGQNSASVKVDSHVSGRSEGDLKRGEFVSIHGVNGPESKIYVAGPEDASSGILIVHDFFGITPATKEAVERLGALGYRTAAVDLYSGKFASSNDSAQILMQAKDRKTTDVLLQNAIRYLKRPGRKLATIGFSAGGIDAVYANLMDPESFSATVVIYAGDYDKIEKSKLETLKSPILAITGSLDGWAVESAFHFFQGYKDKSFEIYIYPGADHGYAQPFFLGGKNYNAEASRMTWKLTEDFLFRHLQH